MMNERLNMFLVFLIGFLLAVSLLSLVAFRCPEPQQCEAAEKGLCDDKMIKEVPKEPEEKRKVEIKVNQPNMVSVT